MSGKVKIELAPGKYRLKETVQNPKPDRRVTRDWRAEVEWEKGMKFIVTERDLSGKGEPPFIIREIARYGGWSSNTLPVRAPSDKDDIAEMRFMALLPHLELVTTENLGDIFTGPNNVETHNATELLAILMDMGKIKFEDVRVAANRLNEMDEDAYDALRAKHCLTYKD